MGVYCSEIFFDGGVETAQRFSWDLHECVCTAQSFSLTEEGFPGRDGGVELQKIVLVRGRTFSENPYN